MNKIKYQTLWLSALAGVIMIIITLLNYGNLPPQIPLFYTLPEGDSQIADLPVIFLLPALMIVFVLTNNIIRKKYFPGNLFIRKFIDYVNISIIILTTLIFIRIIILVR